MLMSHVEFTEVYECFWQSDQQTNSPTMQALEHWWENCEYSSALIYEIQEHRVKLTLKGTTFASNALLIMQEGNEVCVGAKTERTDTDRTFILFVLCPLSHSLSISHTRSEERRWRHPTGPVSFWLASWGLIQLGDFHSPPISREKTL